MKVRITFSKQGTLRYCSHLDLHKIWERAVRRAGLPLAYSRGFHPLPRISLASALPLGFTSRAEMLEINLQDDLQLEQIGSQLRPVLPHDIAVLDIRKVDEREPVLQSRLVSAEYEVTLTEELPEDELQNRLGELQHARSIPRQRRGKPYDLRPLIEDIGLIRTNRLDGEKVFSLFMRLSSRAGATGRPEEVLDELGIPLEDAHIERTRLIFSQDSIK